MDKIKIRLNRKFIFSIWFLLLIVIVLGCLFVCNGFYLISIAILFIIYFLLKSILSSLTFFSNNLTFFSPLSIKNRKNKIRYSEIKYVLFSQDKSTRSYNYICVFLKPNKKFLMEFTYFQKNSILAIMKLLHENGVSVRVDNLNRNQYLREIFDYYKYLKKNVK